MNFYNIFVNNIKYNYKPNETIDILTFFRNCTRGNGLTNQRLNSHYFKKKVPKYKKKTNISVPKKTHPFLCFLEYNCNIIYF